MSRNNYIFSLVYFIVMLSFTKCDPRFATPGTFKVGETCERDIECIHHAFCRSQLTCLCDPFYAPSLDMGTCHVTAGAPCNIEQRTELCDTMSNAECRQNVCTCKDDFMIDINNSSNCIMRPKAAGDICQRNDDCKDSLEMALCINGKCKCYTEYHFVNSTGTCIKNRGLYMPCKRDYECFLEADRPDALECKNGECACREGKCANDSTMYQPIFIILATLTIGSTFRIFI